MTLTDRERATLVAALLHWQRVQAAGDTPLAPEHWADEELLTTEEIDDLCTRLEERRTA